MRRVVFVTRTHTFGGTEHHLLQVLRRLDANQVASTVLCLGEDVYGPVLARFAVSGVRVVRVPDARTLFALWRRLVSVRGETIIFVKGEFELFGWQAYFAARLAGGRHVYAIEQLIAHSVPAARVNGGPVRAWARRWIGWRARTRLRAGLGARFLDATVSVSEAVRQRLVNDYGYPPARTITVRNGVDVDHYGCGSRDGRAVRAALGVDAASEVAVTVAALVEQKRIDIVLDAMAILSKRRPNSRCLIVGDGPLRSVLVTRARALGLSKSVIFVGHVSDVRPYVAAADVFVLASEREGLPLALLEAMVQGVPAVVTDVGGNAEAVRHDRDGIVVAPGDAREVARALEALFSDQGERRRLGASAAAWVRESFDIERHLKTLSQLMGLPTVSRPRPVARPTDGGFHGGQTANPRTDASSLDRGVR